MIYGGIYFEIKTKENFTWESELSCDYDAETLRYAVEHLLSHCQAVCEDCAQTSWKLRTAKANIRLKVRYLAEASYLELPVGWVAISGRFDATGLTVNRIKLYANKPSERVLDADDPETKKRRAVNFRQVRTWYRVGSPNCPLPDLCCKKNGV